eukprot:scaffold24060_cov50-Attheya_sp.AAC.4
MRIPFRVVGRVSNEPCGTLIRPVGFAAVPLPVVRPLFVHRVGLWQHSRASMDSTTFSAR